MKQKTLDEHLDNMEAFMKALLEYKDSLSGQKNTRLAIIQAKNACRVVEEALDRLDFLGFGREGKEG